MTGDVRAPAGALEQWASSVLVAVGSLTDHAEATARVLLAASLRGIDSHGVARLPAYTKMIERGLVDVTAHPEVQRHDGATATIDAHNCLGAVAGEMGMREACRLAVQHGVGWVSVRRSNHFGIAGHYVRMAAAQGCIGIASTNAAATVAPTRSRGRFFGTNPMAFGFPTSDDDPVVLDMSTSAVSGGKFEVAMRAGAAVPMGWGLTSDGEDTTDPAAVYRDGGALLPLGSFEEGASHKGYGLALVVEILCALLVGGAHGPGVGALTSAEATHRADVGHFFVALSPDRFGDPRAFADRMTALASELRELPARNADRPVLVPGDDERAFLLERQRDGIPLDRETVRSLADLAARTQTTLPANGLAALGDPATA